MQWTDRDNDMTGRDNDVTADRRRATDRVHTMIDGAARNDGVIGHLRPRRGTDEDRWTEADQTDAGTPIGETMGETRTETDGRRCRGMERCDRTYRMDKDG